jgi:hypothetical protein
MYPQINKKILKIITIKGGIIVNTYVLPFNAQEITEKLKEHNGLKEQLEVLNTLNKSYENLNEKQQQLSET